MRRITLSLTVIILVSAGTILAVDISNQPPPLNPSQNRSMAITQGSIWEGNILLKGKVTAAFGRVEVRTPGSIIWSKARIGRIISEGYQIRTGRDGKVQLRFATNLINLKPNTTLTVSESTVNTLTGKYTNIFECPEGKARFEIKDNSRVAEFKVKTPTAIAGARGTIFFLLVTQTFTEALVQQGALFFESMLSGQILNLGPGFMSKITHDGRVTDPKEIPAQYREMMNEGWTPPGGLEPDPQGGLGPDGKVGDLFLLTEGTVTEQGETVEEALDDKLSSQATEKTQFVDVPDYDRDGLPDYMDPDDDNDWLLDVTEKSLGTNPRDDDTDNDLVPDGHEVWFDSNPLLANSDGTGANDFEDCFPADSASDEPDMVTEVRDERYDRISAIPGLRLDIADMLRDSVQRQRDWIIDKVSDAQRGKVLTDRLGNRVRVEQYVFRPKSNEVTVLSMSYRDQAGPYMGLTTMKFSATLNASLDTLTSQQVRGLPWNDWVGFDVNDGSGGGTLQHGSNPPPYYPVSMMLEFRSPPRNLPDIILGETRNYGPLVLNSGTWEQLITHGDFVVNLGGSGNVPYSYGGATTNVDDGASVPRGFSYDGFGGNSIKFSFWVRNDAGGIVDVTGQGLRYDNAWEILGSNVDGYPEHLLGPNNLEVGITSPILFSGDEMDLIFFPIDENHMYWKQDFSWKK